MLQYQTKKNKYRKYDYKIRVMVKKLTQADAFVFQISVFTDISPFFKEKKRKMVITYIKVD